MKLVVITIIMCSSNNVVISLYYCDINIVSSSLYLYVDFDNDKNIQKFELLPVETVQSILDFITYFIRQAVKTHMRENLGNHPKFCISINFR